MTFALLLLLFLLNGCFALVEIAFVASRRARLEELALGGNRKARSALALLENPERLFSAIQVGITLIGTLAGTLGALRYARPLAERIAAAPPLAPYALQIATAALVLLITYASIVIGELAPKTIALRAPERIAMAAAPAMRLFIHVALPLVALFSLSTKILLAALGFGAEQPRGEDPREEILVLARVAAVKRQISNEQQDIVARTMRLSTVRAQDIMISREDMKTLTTSMSLAEALIEAHIHHHTRFPLVDGDDPNRIIGYVNFKDIVSALQINPGEPSLRGISRPIMTVAPSESAAELLARMIRQYQHIALVTDPERGVLGMVCMEDVIETILGDIYDEYDLLPSFVYRIAENRFVVGGGTPVHTLREKTSAELPDSAESLSQWLKQVAERPPRVEDRIRWRNALFIVRRVSRSEIREAILDIGPAA